MGDHLVTTGHVRRARCPVVLGLRREYHPPPAPGTFYGLADVGDAILTLSIMMGWRSFGPAFRAALARVP